MIRKIQSGPRYFSEWEKFINSPNPKKIVFNEGNSYPSKGETREEAIINGADTGTTAWLAQKAGIDYLSPEPDFHDEINSLKSFNGFSEDEIMRYYIGRQMSQWVRYDHSRFIGIDEYLDITLKRYLNVYEWKEKFSVLIVRKLVEDFIGKKLEEGTKSDFLKIDDPSQNSVSSACSQIRNLSIYTAIEKAWGEGKDIFCVFGSGHAIVMEPALRNLFGLEQ